MKGTTAYILCKNEIAMATLGIASITTSGNTIIITYNAGNTATLTVNPPRGLGIKDVLINTNNHLICIYDDNTATDAGEIPSGGTTTYSEDITTASNTWTIQHNLNTPWYGLIVSIIDDNNNVIYGDIDAANSTNNLIVVKFNTPITGKIIIKK